MGPERAAGQGLAVAKRRRASRARRGVGGRTSVTLTLNRTKWHTKLNTELKDRLSAIGRMMKSYFYRQLTGVRTGNIYRVTALGSIKAGPLGGGHGIAFTYQASAPHEYPAERTGLLRKSMRFVTGMGRSGPYLHVGVVGPAGYYAAELENGDHKGARPFIRRAFIEKEAAIAAVLTKKHAFSF